MNVALIENAEHNVNGGERGGNQQRRAAKRVLIGLGRPGESGVDRWRKTDLAGGRFNGIDGIAKRHPRLKVEGDRNRWKEPLVSNGKGRCNGGERAECAQWNLVSVR